MCRESTLSCHMIFQQLSQAVKEKRQRKELVSLIVLSTVTSLLLSLTLLSPSLAFVNLCSDMCFCTSLNTYSMSVCLSVFFHSTMGLDKSYLQWGFISRCTLCEPSAADMWQVSRKRNIIKCLCNFALFIRFFFIVLCGSVI